MSMLDGSTLKPWLTTGARLPLPQFPLRACLHRYLIAPCEWACTITLPAASIPYHRDTRRSFTTSTCFFTMQAASFTGGQVPFPMSGENRVKITLVSSLPLIRATPLSGRPFVCSVDFAVIQAAIQYDNIRLLSSSTSSSV